METPFPTHQPPEPRKDSLGQRYKFIWRFFLISNLALGAYMFAMARKRDMSAENGKTAAKVHSTPVPEEPAPVHEEPAPTPIVELMKEPTPPLHEEQKRELFEWMLEEKRKIKPKDRLEKKRIDEEKSILKQFIRSKSIPDL